MIKTAAVLSSALPRQGKELGIAGGNVSPTHSTPLVEVPEHIAEPPYLLSSTLFYKYVVPSLEMQVPLNLLVINFS